MPGLSRQEFDQFETALAASQLDKVVQEMIAEGKAQVEIAYRFDLFRDYLRQTGREDDEDRVMDIMDCIWGYCSPHARYFSHYLTSEEFDEYRRTSGAQHNKNNAGNGN